VNGAAAARVTAAAAVVLGAVAVATTVGTPAARAAAGAQAQVAVVVGASRSVEERGPPLRYADDDAVQSARTFALIGAHTILLVEPDEETRELQGEALGRGPATRAAVTAALGDAFTALAAARAAGRPTRLYFVFSGHGDVADGRPFLQLSDGRLYRDDLANLLRRSPADDNHLIIDACQASLFVGARGPGGRRSRLPPGFSQLGGPAWPPRTGLLTARSSGGQTHEWTEYQAGIFSHEVRSGLLGAADADRDGRVTYRELGAFVRRANEAVVNRKYRPEVVTLAPAGDFDAVLAELPAGPMVLEVDGSAAARHGDRMFIETERGLRLVDVHPERGLKLELRLPTDRGPLYVQRQGSDTEVRIDPRAGRLRLAALAPSPTRLRTRGAAHEAFQQLFARPFGPGAVAGYRPELDLEAAAAAQTAEEEEQRRQILRRVWPWSVTATGVAANAVGLGYGVWAHRLSRQAQGASGLERQQLAADVRRNNRTAVIAGTMGVTLTLSGLAWLWLTQRQDGAGEP
jgi:hypothetical protein